MRVRFGKPKDFGFDMLPVFIELADVQQTFLEFGGLLTRRGPIHGSLNFFNRVLTALVNKRSRIKLLSRMVQNVLDDGTRGFPKHVRKHIVQLQVGNGQAVLSTVLFPVDSMQTSEQEYFASQSAKSCSPLGNEEKRACLYSVRPLESVIPIQANIQVL